MNYSWFSTVFPLSAIFAFRMLGLFMLIPVFTVFAQHLRYASPSLIGVALGSYGLSQALLQIPFGLLSDRFGRKPLITIGLLLFIFGSIIGALSDSIYTMIFARTMQGTGAIGSVLIALLADLTKDVERSKAMAVIGITIGISFGLAMILSPFITNIWGLSGIFYLTALLGLLGLAFLHLLIPNPKKEQFYIDGETQPSLLKTVLTNKHLQRLNAGIFVQHFILTSTFYAMPLLLEQQLALGHLRKLWHFYFLLMLLAFICMLPFLVIAERKQKMKPVFLLSVLTTCLMQILLIYCYQDWLSLCCISFIYFLVFNILEATLPSLVSKQAGFGCKGTAMGIYSSSQFLGLFIGGSTAGILYQYASFSGIFVMNAIMAFLWLTITLHMQYAPLNIK